MTPDYSPLWYWVKEREAIRVKKTAGAPPPWTDDPILAKFRFCNVRREDDRVTMWIAENIRKPFADHPLLWLMLCIARQINWPDTLERLINYRDLHDGGGAWPDSDAFSPETMRFVMKHMQDNGLKVYTGAYTITAPPAKGASKIDFTCETVIGQLWCAASTIGAYFRSPGRTIRGAHAVLMRYKAWGEFMAYQAVGDMIFTKILEGAPDRNLWCAAGPGTLRGLNRIHGRPVDYRLSQEQARSEIRKIFAIAQAETGVALEFNDVPNILCETDKYLRVKNGEGAPRATYVPGRGF